MSWRSTLPPDRCISGGGFRTHLTGVATVTAGVLVLSFDALLIRLAQAAAFDVAFWRGALMATTLCLFLGFSGWRESLQRVLAFGPAALASALLQGVGSTLFVLAISRSSVASTVVLIATAPLFAAIASHFFLHERVPRRTWLACLVVLLGVALIFRNAFASSEITGNLCALSAAITLGGNLNILRRYPPLPRIPVVAASGIVTALLALPFSTPLLLSKESYMVLAVMGMLQMPLALILITSATRFLPSAEVSLFLLLETLLGPVWVWLVLDENVSPNILLGGSIIVATLLLHGWISIRTAGRPTEPGHL